MEVIKVENLKKKFNVKLKEKGLKGSFKALVKPNIKTVNAVKGINFSVNEGEIIIMGLDPTKERKKLAYKIGTVFGQKEQLWMHLTPYDNFRFFAAVYDISNEEAEKRIAKLKETFELEKFINIPVRNLSLGQRIRCEIVASLIHEPKILFLDEPTIGLDPLVKESVRKLIKKMNKEYKTTIFLTSHDVSDIEKLCKRVIIINNGEIVLDDSMINLKYRYMNKKIIEVKLKEKIEIENIEGISILKSKESNIKFEIDTRLKNLSDILKLINPDNILDMNISNVPLEEIISDIYKGGDNI